MATLNSYTIKWAVITTVSDKGFNRNYRSALKNAGFQVIGKNGDVAVNHYNSNNPKSVERLLANLATLKNKVDNYKHKVATLNFTITDHQFGLIGSKKVEKLKMKKVPTSMGLIPVTTNQFLYTGNFNNPTSYRP